MRFVLSYSCAALDRSSADSASRGPSATVELLVKMFYRSVLN